MTSFFIALVLSAPPASPTNAEPAAKAGAERGYHEIAKEMRELLKREALAKSRPERAEALCDLCVLYKELLRDSRLSVSDTLKEYKTTVWSRLTRSKNDIKAQLARDKRNAPKSKPSADDNSELLAASAAEDSRQASLSLASQMALMSYSLGGPAQVFAEGASHQQRGAPGGGGTVNYGQELIDLIERTISPDTWDVNGGPGSIVYWSGLMALVVRAPSEVHGDVGGLLEGLRAAGR